MRGAIPRAPAAILAGLLAAGTAPASADYEAARKAFERGDFQTGLSALRAAAHDGDARAQNHLGTLYEDGRIVVRDFGRAVFWYRRAAKQGDAQGQLNLGRAYRGGLGLERDEYRAAHWYRIAAGQGVAAAQFFLGVMYEAGRGVERDPVEAWMWFSLAADQGDEDARFRRDRLTAAFEEEELARAEGVLRGYREAREALGPDPSRTDAAPGPPAAAGAADGASSPSPHSAPRRSEVRGNPLVFRIQGALIALGYEPGEQDGEPGSRTRDALRQFEVDNGFRRRGRFDERSLRRLRNAIESEKLAASAVREIQTRLDRLGHPVGIVDGRPGPRTAAAVEAFQRAQGLSVDGRVSLGLLHMLRDTDE